MPPILCAMPFYHRLTFSDPLALTCGRAREDIRLVSTFIGSRRYLARMKHHRVDPALDPRRALVDRKVLGGGRRGCRTACTVYASAGMTGIGYGNRQIARCSNGRRQDRGR